MREASERRVHRFDAMKDTKSPSVPLTDNGDAEYYGTVTLGDTSAQIGFSSTSPFSHEPIVLS